jgi:hypothetical protein
MPRFPEPAPEAITADIDEAHSDRLGIVRGSNFAPIQEHRALP